MKHAGSLATALVTLLIPFSQQAKPLPDPLVISTAWKLQDAVKVPSNGEDISQAAFAPADWYSATVPGTALTTLVNNKVYPELLYGEHNRPHIMRI